MPPHPGLTFSLGRGQIKGGGGGAGQKVEMRTPPERLFLWALIYLRILNKLCFQFVLTSNLLPLACEQCPQEKNRKNILLNLRQQNDTSKKQNKK